VTGDKQNNPDHRLHDVFARVRDLLNRHWDPIGVVDDGITDEYDSYVGQVYQRVRHHRDADALVQYLREVEEESMGLRPTSANRIQQIFVALKHLPGMQRLLIPTVDFPPIEGGISTVTLQLARELAARGHAVTVIAPWFADMESFDAGEPYVVVRFRGYDRGWLRFFPLLLATRRLAREHDVLLAINVAYGGIVGRMLGMPYVCFAYAYEFLKFQSVPPLRWLLQSVYDRAESTVAISRFTRDNLVAFGVDPMWIEVAYPGASMPQPRDEERIAALEESFGLGDGPVVLSVGRFIPRKNHRVLVEAWPKVLDAVPDAQLVMAGRGPERDACIARAEQLGVSDSVHCPGYLEDADVAQLYHRCDVFALPNGEDAKGQVEGFGLVFAEAAAYGKPVIAGDSGGAREAVVDGETGLLVPPGDAGALAEALVRLLSDAGLRERMGAAGRDRVARELNWARFADAVLESIGVEV